ncbi:hypothetical protein [Pukyongiella litopenaei]|uniref:Uncharacterized protein n=1 Tax=Pukyongiella litopenaei TaxID=2605946 RepID=A0A2S0MLK6_9RHOB|nr:hypothetical protein [Pukyongiella litopenaei]AVO36756.2 hypothetical protein C6Y53_02975 [Pukyongiella litopenaei]
MKSKLLYLAGGCAFVLASALVYRTATAITQNDVLANLGLGSGVLELGVRAGDVYSISPDGTRSERICGLKLDDRFVNEVNVDAIYANSMRELMPDFLGFLAGGASLQDARSLVEVMKTDEGKQTAQLRLVGLMTQIRKDTERADTPEFCECEMARHLNRRHRVCSVRSSLIPESNPELSAFNFATFSNMIPEAVFERCGLEKSEAARQIETQTCPSDTGVPWDVALRRALGVVEPRDMVDQAGQPPAADVGS